MWHAAKRTNYGHLVNAEHAKAQEPLNIFLCAVDPFIVTEVREVHEYSPFGAMEFDTRVGALEAARLISVPGRRIAIRVAGCPHGCGELEWISDTYYCRRCGDEFSHESIRGFPIPE